MNELQIRATMNFDAVHPIMLWKISSNLITAIKHNSLLTQQCMLDVPVMLYHLQALKYII